MFKTRKLRPPLPLLGCIIGALLLSSGPSLAQNISAGKNRADEDAHIKRIEDNKKKHFACVVSVGTSYGLRTKLSKAAISQASLKHCDHFEAEHRFLLQSGAPTTSGAIAAVGSDVIARLMN